MGGVGWILLEGGGVWGGILAFSPWPLPKTKIHPSPPPSLDPRIRGVDLAMGEGEGGGDLVLKYPVAYHTLKTEKISVFWFF